MSNLNASHTKATLTLKVWLKKGQHFQGSVTSVLGQTRFGQGFVYVGGGNGLHNYTMGYPR